MGETSTGNDRRRGNGASKFIFVLGSFCLTFLCVVLALLICKCPNFTCYLLLPYRDYDRWRTADNSARSQNGSSSGSDDFLEHCIIPLEKLEKKRIKQLVFMILTTEIAG